MFNVYNRYTDTAGNLHFTDCYEKHGREHIIRAEWGAGMSECVVRMEMPEGCLDCPCANGEYGYCQADKEERQIGDPNERPSWCPIICSLPAEEENPSPKPTDPVPIRDVYYVMTECDVKTGTVTYELRERSET